MMFSGLTLTVVINVLLNIIIPTVKQPIFFLISKHTVYEYVSGLNLTAIAELFYSCKRRKFIDQNKANILSF